MRDETSSDTRPELTGYYSVEARRAREAQRVQLLRNVKQTRESLLTLSQEFDAWEEDGVYRFYHESYKVFQCQNLIRAAFILLDPLAPEGTELNDMFGRIILDAISKEFVPETTNPNWPAETRPLLEAFWHCKYVLTQLVCFAELDEIPELLPSGVAAVLQLYGVR